MRRHIQRAQILLLAATFILLSACNLPHSSPTAVRQGPTPQAGGTPFTPATTATGPAVTILTLTPGGLPSTPPAATAAATLAAAYPDSPEGVVQAFVEAYPDDTSGMQQYLSASLKASLPQGGPGELLNVQGDVNGFVILSGSTVPQPPQAVIQGAFQVGTQQVLRTFNLTQENGQWVINGIQ